MDRLDFAGEESDNRLSISIYDAYKIDREGWREAKIFSRFKETRFVSENLNTWDEHALEAYFKFT